jgi:hypothetical protein
MPVSPDGNSIYNHGDDAWEVVTNRYDTGGTDAACTFVASNSIYGFWTGWTPMQRWTWDKNSLGVVQQATVGSAALHPVDGVRVGNLGVFVLFESGAGSCNGGVLLNNDRVYIEADGNAGGTFCLDADSGAIFWHNNAPTNAGTWSGNGPSLSPDGAAVYVHTEGDPGGLIFAMDTLTGSTLWFRVYASGWGGQEPIVDNAGNSYCAFDGVSAPAGNDVLISFKPNGTTNWIFDLGMHNAWFHGGYALSPDGTVVYCSRRSGGGGVVGAGNLILGVFQTATGRAVKAIKDNGASGDVLWSTQIAASGATWTWPTLLPNGDVIAMTEFVIARITLPTPAPPIGWCNLQWPYTLTVINTNGPGVSDKIYGQIWIDGVTSNAGPTPGLKAWVGYGPSDALPNAPSWSWTPADFNVQVGNNDEFHTNFVIAQAVPAGV